MIGSKQIKNFRHPYETVLYIAAAILIMIGLLIGGKYWVSTHLIKLYPVLLEGQEVGYAFDQKVIEQYKDEVLNRCQKQYPGLEISLPRIEVSQEVKVLYGNSFSNQEVLNVLDEKVQPQAKGVAIRVDGNTVGYVNNQATADRILAELKDSFGRKSEVGVLSVDGPDQVEQVQFVEKVSTSQVQVPPGIVMGEEKMMTKLRDREGPLLSVKTVKQVTETEKIGHETEIIWDDTTMAGRQEVIVEGKDGKKQVTIERTKVDGQIIEEKVIREDVLENPVTEKIKKGTKESQGKGTGKFIWPVLSPSITSTFGERWGKMHKGIDMTGNRVIMAADNGKVVNTGSRHDYGNYIIMDHTNGFQTVYMHLGKIDTSVGRIVEKGEKIGMMGSTGFSTGVHLHFEIHLNGDLQNPLKYLAQ
ncbi:peptidoglycan DD-metalloendopeptidase family protein [Paenibacillus larvae]|uniref:peptidoglycan DD-metalloendopeptidase family protein n=1 Tax=Paenibacillus larvae TaxID=1464 RepID=UPI002853D139|nr:peptidoglycan DD-metalloendopeptidase family protein [Paenibacillus larvae]MDR5599147.1 peptidoglycan DD-metalloendopeptidase family protein [Paenibacillus larvae]